MKSLKKLVMAVQQRFYRQTLMRMPEMDLVMIDQDEDAQYTRDGEDGSLAILYDFVINTLLKISPLSGEAVDICCGSAQLLCKMARAMPQMHFTGIDLSRRMLEFAEQSKKRYDTPNVGFKIGNMYKLDLSIDKQVDLITWNLAMHHCDSEEKAVQVLNQIWRILKKDGCLFVFDIIRPKTGRLALEFANLYNRLWGDWFFQDALDSYKAAFSFEEVENFLRESDLKGYRHIQPVIGNVFQMIIVSQIRRKHPEKISHLRFNWQKRDYAFMNAVFGSGI